MICACTLRRPSTPGCTIVPSSACVLNLVTTVKGYIAGGQTRDRRAIALKELPHGCIQQVLREKTVYSSSSSSSVFIFSSINSNNNSTTKLYLVNAQQVKWRTIESLAHKIRLRGRRGKGTAESFSREK